MNWYRRIGLAVCALAVMVALSGCHKRTHREVRVHEETKVGEVHEAPRGEMVPE
jgi:hypothetical protein